MTYDPWTTSTALQGNNKNSLSKENPSKNSLVLLFAQRPIGHPAHLGQSIFKKIWVACQSARFPIISLFQKIFWKARGQFFLLTSASMNRRCETSGPLCDWQRRVCYSFLANWINSVLQELLLDRCCFYNNFYRIQFDELLCTSAKDRESFLLPNEQQQSAIDSFCGVPPGARHFSNQFLNTASLFSSQHQH